MALRAIPEPYTRDYPDWFVADEDIAAIAAQSPGVQQLKTGEWIIHRTHLPLLGEVKVADSATTEAIGIGPWMSRTGISWPDTFQARPWQIQGALFAASRRGSLIRFDPRMGKTAIPLMAPWSRGRTGQILICAPPDARDVWEEWVGKFFPSLRFVTAEGRRPTHDALSAPVLFIHHAIAASWSVPGLKPALAIIDEPHLLFSRRTRRLNSVNALAYGAKKVILLDGTPIWDDPVNLWGILGLAAPGAWGSYQEFAARYCGGHKGPWGFETGDATNVEELRARMTECVIDRSWEGQDLLHHRCEVVPLDGYAAAEVEGTATALRRGGPASGIGHAVALRRALAKHKRRVVIGEVLAALHGGHTHVVVWGWLKETISRIVSDTASLALESFAVTGDDSALERAEQIDRWRKSGGVLAITLGVGQVAIDLSAARFQIFAEPDWTPTVNDQASYRCVHPSRPTETVWILAEHPVDQAIARAVDRKARAAASVGLPVFSAGAQVLADAFGLRDRGDMERLRRALQEDL